MNTTPNHTAADALAYVANIVKNRIDCATDAIGGNIPTEGVSATELHAGNEWALDFLNDLTKEVLDIARPHCDGPTYSDGRLIWSTVTTGDNSTLTHYWNPDPTKDTRREIVSPSRGGRTIVTLIPPSTAEAVFYPADDDGSLPDDPAHPTLDNAPRWLITDEVTALLRHDASDEFVNVRAAGVYTDDGITGATVELGPWSMSPLEARQLGDSLRNLAAAADPRLA
ncbi:hypothetical protein [Rhodococcus sp. UFZ-B548]|uniref:hypothetical protein n=1 Tax=Rhodococcus sp. UFZ-B548 TaxID=2742212 RepID=UPI0015F6B71E|nr:hypothetical protein [Rhodococcus sp. UFZ-B548]